MEDSEQEEPQGMSRCLICGQYAVQEWDGRVESESRICDECTTTQECP